MGKKDYLRASIPIRGPIIYVDMDGVISDYDWYTSKEIAKGRHKMSVYKDEGSFRDLPVIEGALEGVKRLEELGFEIYFLSTAMWCNPSSFQDKRIWIEKEFGNLAKKKLILCHNKGIVKGEGNYLIDDRVANGVADFQGEHIHFGQGKFPDWPAVVKYFESLC